jgi:catechol 2,3-dioxygenase-like lactoylglutathione lyase family enzyme
MNPLWSHIGICVSDMERSLRFYCEAFGFVPTESYVVGNEYRGLMEMSPDKDVKLHSRFLQHDGPTRIELLYFESPPSDVTGDLDAVLEKIRALGGEVADHTRTRVGNFDVVYCSDPDGIRIEVYTEK